MRFEKRRAEKEEKKEGIMRGTAEWLSAENIFSNQLISCLNDCQFITEMGMRLTLTHS